MIRLLSPYHDTNDFFPLSDVIPGFLEVNFLEDLAKDKLYLLCFVKRLERMQHSSY
jgi:hypothetical protein